MKPIYLTLTLTLLFLKLSFSQTLNPKVTEKTVSKISDKLYAGKTEVKNIDYLEFIYFLKKNNEIEKLAIAQLDTQKWTDKMASNEPYVIYYHKHPAYAEYPVVNVSYEGATLYCQWLTDLYNNSPKRKFKKVQFRLPTEKEWILAAQGGNSAAIYRWEGNSLQTKKEAYRCNFKRCADCNSNGIIDNVNEYTDVTAPVKSYRPNTFGLYNISGNVAEMLVDKGHTKGGSWLDDAEAMKINTEGKFTHFDGPMSTIGFRYFMEVIEE